MKNLQITHWCHEIIRSQAKAGGHYIDATMGKGNDTVFLCQLAGEKGSVLAFDIQKEALEMTEKKLEEKGLADRAKLILDGHEHMDTGFEEKDRILAFLKQISPKIFTVITNEYYNRENNPPMPVFVFKN